MDRPVPAGSRVGGSNRFCPGLLVGLSFLAVVLIVQRRRGLRAEQSLRELNARLERRLAERTAELAESEERLRRLSDNLPDGAVYQCAREPNGDVRFLYFSAGIETLNGVRPEDVLRDPAALRGQFPPEYRERLAEAEARSARELSDFEMEAPMHRPDGEVRWMRLKSRPRRAPDGRVVWDGAQTDVTERRRAAETLAVSERKYRELIETANSVILRWDRRGTIRFVNEYGARFFGYAPGELEGRDVMAIVPEVESGTGRDLDALVKDIAARPELHTSVPNENIRKDGTSIWMTWTNKAILDERGNVREILSVGNDITALKRTEAALRKSEQRLRMAIDAAFLISFEWDIPKNEVRRHRSSDPALAPTPEDAPATFESVRDVVHFEDRERFAANVFGALEREDGRYESEHRIVHPDGTVRWLSERGVVERDAEGRPARLLGLSRDITDRKRAGEILRASERRVRRKLESVLSPEGAPEDLELADVLETGAVQKLMDEFYALARVPMSIVDLKGRILVGVGWQDICTRFHRLHPETVRNCRESDLRLSGGLKRGECRLYKCRNHLWDMATPLFVANRHAGNIFTGQFFLDDEAVDREFFRAQARKYGFDEAEYLAALDRVPRLNRETVHRGMAFFIQLSNMLSRLGYANLALARLVSERDRLNESLRESRATLEAALASMSDAVFISDAEGRFLHFNDAFATFHRFASREECRETLSEYPEILDVYLPDGSLAPPDMWAVPRALRGERETNAEYTLRRKDTGETWIGSYSFGPIRNKDDEIIGSVVAGQDVTGRKRAERELRESGERLRASLAEKEVMLKEIHHRVKNNMQVISSLVSLQSDEIGDEATRAALDDVTHRVRSMALVHEKLYQSEDLARVNLAEYAESLLNYLWRAHGTQASGVRLNMELKSAPISVEAAVPCGLILNELVSNALKHAFGDRTEGRVTVAVRRDPEGRVHLRVSDDGAGLPPGLDWRNAPSLGLRLVNMLARQLRADVAVRGDGGTEFTIDFGESAA